MIELVIKTEAETLSRRSQLEKLIKNFSISNAELVKHKFIDKFLYIQVKIREEHEIREG